MGVKGSVRTPCLHLGSWLWSHQSLASGEATLWRSLIPASGAGRWLGAGPGRGGGPLPAAPPPASLPRPPRPAREGIASRTRGVGAPTGLARCSARVSGDCCAPGAPRCLACQCRVPAPSQLDTVALGIQVTEGGTPRPCRRWPQRARPPRLPVHARPARGLPAGSLGPAGRSEGGSGEVRARTAVRRAAVKCSPVPRTPSARLLPSGAEAVVGRLLRALRASAEIGRVLPSRFPHLLLFRAFASRPSRPPPLRRLQSLKKKSLDGDCRVGDFLRMFTFVLPASSGQITR